MEEQTEPLKNDDVKIAEEVSESSDSNLSISTPFSSNKNKLSQETPTKSSDVKIEEMCESRNNPAGPITASEPIIIEQKGAPETSNKKNWIW